MGQDLGDVRAEGVVEIVHAGEPADLPVGELDGVGAEDAALVHQHVLDDPDRRPQADAAGGTGEGPDEFQQKVEVLRQKRIEARERSRIGVALEQGRTGKAGVGDQGLSVFFEQGFQLLPPLLGFVEQTPVCDLTDVARVEMDGNREAVPQLVELSGVMRGLFDDFAQGLLAGGGDPNLAFAELLEIAGQPVEVEDQLAAGGDVLTGLVHKEQNVFMPGLAPADVDDLTRQVPHVPGFLEPQSAEALRRGEIIGQDLRHDLRRAGHADQRIVVDFLPRTLVTPSVFILELIVLSAAVECELELSGLFFFGKTRPLKHLPIKHGGDRGGGAFGELLSPEIKQHHRRGVFLGDGAQCGRNLVAGETVAKEIKEGLAADGTHRVKGRAEVFGERALAAAVKAGYPDADLGHLTAPDAFAENIEELAEAGLDVVRNLVFGDLSGKAVLLLGVIVDDFLNSPVYVTPEVFVDFRHR